MMRPMRSEPPPGALVAMISTGFSGFHSCAAARGSPLNAVGTANAKTVASVLFRGAPPCQTLLPVGMIRLLLVLVVRIRLDVVAVHFKECEMGKLRHIAIAVPDTDEAAKFY